MEELALTSCLVNDAYTASSHAHCPPGASRSLTLAVSSLPPLPCLSARRFGGLDEHQTQTLGTEQSLLTKLAEAGVDAADTKISAQKEKAPAVVEKVRAKQAEVAATTRWVGHGKQSQFNLAAWPCVH